VSLPQRVIELHRFAGSRLPWYLAFFGTQYARNRATSIGLGETAPCGSIVGLQFDCFLKVRLSLCSVVLREPEEFSVKISVVRFRVDMTLRRHRGCSGFRFCRDNLRQFRGQGGRPSKVAVIALRPDVGIARNGSAVPSCAHGLPSG
jgi:hypothetical protein